ncbi:MAG: hypothetical protein H7Y12_13155 [Sphingobacteriaceae bacterium]|nr:hypothetical protein [Cytophagaceae bacterium]
MRFGPIGSFLLGLLGVGLSACRPLEDSSVPTEGNEARIGYDFFPLETGRFIEYDVQEIQYSLTTPPVVTTYQVRERVGEGFAQTEGITSYRLERFRRSEESQPWRLDSVYTQRRETTRALRTEHNVAYVKLIFPVIEGLRWNGNAFNANGPETYELRELDRPLRVGNQVFERTLTVVQRADSSLVSLQRRTEYYARGIGLIYRENTQFFYCNSPDCLGKGTVDFGTQLIYRIRTHGKE